ncbi:MAG: glycosyltransferase [Candidatus Kapaibacterium sp.]|nr:glycosyltransferase [Ignavibacteriota bacterium]
MRISVVICVKNRKDDLKVTLNGFYNQKYNDFEIIVIDNASDDGTYEMIKNEFPNVRYTFLPININILAQNIGISQATGDIIWRTDSDSHPESSDTFEHIVSIFENQPDLDIISTTETLVKKDFKEIILSSLNKDLGNDIDGYLVKSFSGPGSAIRKSVFNRIGYYWEFGMEELDLSIRALKNNLKIKHFPNIRTLHFSSDFERNKSARWLKISTQNLRIITKYYPFTRLYNLFICFWGQFLFGIGQKVKPSYFFEFFFQSFVTVINTWRDERDVVGRKDFKKIIGENEYYIGFYSFIKNKLR